MNDLPENLSYAITHEWAAQEAGAILAVGITEFAQEQLGDVVYLKLPELGQAVVAGEPCAVVESVKTASDLHSPATGEVVAVNDALQDAPEQINEVPYQAWIFKVKADNLAELGALMDAVAYRQHIR